MTKNKTIESISNCPAIHLDDKGVLRNAHAIKRYGFNKTEATVNMQLIGFNSEGELLAVDGWDWTVFKIKNAEFEQVGELGSSLRAVINNPSILLNEVKVMSLEEIEKKLGYKVMLKR